MLEMLLQVGAHLREQAVEHISPVIEVEGPRRTGRSEKRMRKSHSIVAAKMLIVVLLRLGGGEAGLFL